MSNRPALIGISGQIGAGKSTLVRTLGSALGLRPLPERDHANPYLERFYREPKAWALQNFLYFFEQSLMDQLTAQDESTGGLQERVPSEHLEVFGREYLARGFLSEDEMALLERLWEITSRLVVPPDLLIYLEVEADVALARVKMRAHTGDDRITHRYLEELGEHYDAFVENWRSCPVIRVNTQEVDVRREVDVRQIAQRVIASLPPHTSQPLAR